MPLRRLVRTGLTAAGTLIGGPIGGAIGTAVGGALTGGGGGGGITQAASTSPIAMPMPSMPSLPGFTNPLAPRPANGAAPATSNGSYSGTIESLLGGDRIVMEPSQKVINTSPPGWVVVDMPDGSGKKAVRKEVARCLGLWKPRSKPPITASEWRNMKRAARTEKKARRIAETANFKCTPKTRR